MVDQERGRAGSGGQLSCLSSVVDDGAYDLVQNQLGDGCRGGVAGYLQAEYADGVGTGGLINFVHLFRQLSYRFVSLRDLSPGCCKLLLLKYLAKLNGTFCMWFA